MRRVALPLMLAFAACPIGNSSPDVHFACSVDGDCPSGQVCQGGLCFESADGGADAGLDGGVDAGRDGGSDAGRDAGEDGGRDGGLDAGEDAGHDAGLDAGSDAGRDAGSDGGLSFGDAGPLDAGLPEFDCPFDQPDGGDAGLEDAGALLDSGYAVAIAVDLDQWVGQSATATMTATQNGLPVADQTIVAGVLDAYCDQLFAVPSLTDGTGTADFSFQISQYAVPAPYVVAGLLIVGDAGVAQTEQTVLVSSYASPNGAVWTQPFSSGGGPTITGSDLAVSDGYPILEASPQPSVGASYGVLARVLDVSGGAAQFGVVFHVNSDGSALSFSVDFPADGGPTLAFSDFPGTTWVPEPPFASIPMPIALHSAHEYALYVEASPTAVGGMVWDTLGSVPATFQLEGAVPAAFANGSGIGFYVAGAPNVQLVELTAQ